MEDPADTRGSSSGAKLTGPGSELTFRRISCGSRKLPPQVVLRRQSRMARRATTTPTLWRKQFAQVGDGAASRDAVGAAV